MNTINDLKVQERLLELRKKWKFYQQKGDIDMMKVTEKQARALKIGSGLEK